MDRGGTAAGLVMPVEAGGRYLFRWGAVAFTVDARSAGRIVSLEIDGRNLLTGPDTNAENWGSTFWTSPQADWGWPPPAEIDGVPFEATLDGGILTLRGPASSTPEWVPSESSTTCRTKAATRGGSPPGR
jgi:hypothetical protein